MGRHIDGVHGWHGVRHRNLEGRILLVLSGEGIMCVKSSCSRKKVAYALCVPRESS